LIAAMTAAEHNFRRAHNLIYNSFGLGSLEHRIGRASKIS